MVATSYQATSGAGVKGMGELLEQAAKLLSDPDLMRTAGADAAATVTPSTFSAPIGFNVLPNCGTVTEQRYTDEEWKLVNESRKILGLPALAVSPTCVRVPVLVGHSVAARLRFAREPSVEAALEALRGAPGLAVVDVPTPLDAAGRAEVLVGRVRVDLADPHALNIFVSGDNLLKGAALNAVQLAELVLA